MEDDEPIGDPHGVETQVPRGYYDGFVFRELGRSWRLGLDGKMVQIKSASELFEFQLALKLDELNKICHLSPAQEAKLKLAGHFDIRQFNESVDEKRREFETVRNDPQRFAQFFERDMIQLQRAVSFGLHSHNSLFDKATRRTLTPDQLAALDKAAQDRVRKQYLEHMEVFAQEMAPVLGLKPDQRKFFAQVIVEQSGPPAKYGPLTTQATLFRIAGIPCEKFKPVMSESQMNKLQEQIKAHQVWEKVLKDQGYIPADGSLTKPSPTSPL